MLKPNYQEGQLVLRKSRNSNGYSFNAFVRFFRQSLKSSKFIPVWLFTSTLHYLDLSLYIIPQQGFNVKRVRVSFNSNGDRIYLKNRKLFASPILTIYILSCFIGTLLSNLPDAGIAASGATDAGIIEPNQDPAETIKKIAKAAIH